MHILLMNFCGLDSDTTLDPWISIATVEEYTKHADDCNCHLGPSNHFSIIESLQLAGHRAVIHAFFPGGPEDVSFIVPCQFPVYGQEECS
jgi:hypothetical protein